MLVDVHVGKVGRASLLRQKVRYVGLEGRIELVGRGRSFLDGVLQGVLFRSEGGEEEGGGGDECLSVG